MFIAKIRMLTTEQGGRQVSIYSGYRPHFCFKERVNEGMFDGTISFEKEYIHPGEQATVNVHMHHPEYVSELLKPGQKFTINEGARVVATGEIIEVLPENYN